MDVFVSFIEVCSKNVRGDSQDTRDEVTKAVLMMGNVFEAFAVISGEDIYDVGISSCWAPDDSSPKATTPQPHVSRLIPLIVFLVIVWYPAIFSDRSNAINIRRVVIPIVVAVTTSRNGSIITYSTEVLIRVSSVAIV